MKRVGRAGARRSVLEPRTKDRNARTDACSCTDRRNDGNVKTQFDHRIPNRHERLADPTVLRLCAWTKHAKLTSKTTKKVHTTTKRRAKPPTRVEHVEGGARSIFLCARWQEEDRVATK